MEGHFEHSKPASREKEFSREKLLLEDKIVELAERVQPLLERLQGEVFTEELTHKLPFHGDARGELLWPLYFQAENISETIGSPYEQGKWNEEKDELDVPGGNLRHQDEIMSEGYMDSYNLREMGFFQLAQKVNSASTPEQVQKLKDSLLKTEAEVNELEAAVTDTLGR